MSTMNLKTGLARMIAEVEKLPEGTIFDMATYTKCVIGKTVTWSPTGNDVVVMRGQRQAFEVSIKALRRLFGIKAPKYASSFNKPFASDADELYPAKTWAVIRLFTGDVAKNGRYGQINREDWLKVAKAQYETM